MRQGGMFCFWSPLLGPEAGLCGRKTYIWFNKQPDVFLSPGPEAGSCDRKTYIGLINNQMFFCQAILRRACVAEKHILVLINNQDVFLSGDPEAGLCGRKTYIGFNK
jgi:hypothetical protein